jgi:hypothetical protein
MVVVVVSGVEWMRDGGGWAGAAYMVKSGAGGCLENQSLLRAQTARARTPKSTAN